MPQLPRILTAVPQTLHARLEIVGAIRALLTVPDVVCDGDVSEVSELVRFAARQIAAEWLSILKASVDDPKHPGWPAGTPDGKGGKFRPKGDTGAGIDQSRDTLNSDGIDRPSLTTPPEIPDEEPSAAKAVNTILKAAAYWLAAAAVAGEPAGDFILALEAVEWLQQFRPWIDAYLDPPKTLEELQSDLSHLDGYDIHHIVEQTPARKDGFPDSLIDSPYNLVRIPTLTHWLISAWFSTKNDDYGKLSPRDYLREKTLGRAGPYWQGCADLV